MSRRWNGMRIFVFLVVTLNPPKLEALEAPTTLGTEAEEAEAVKYLEELEQRYSDACNKQTETRWAYITNVTKESENKSVLATNEFGEFQARVQKELLTKFPHLDSFKNETVKRELKYLQFSGPGTMDPAHVAKMNEIQAKMESIYATATVCEYQNPAVCNYTLDPEIEGKMDKSKDYDELAYYWTAWHDVMGSKVTPELYKEFIDLQNEMAKANGFNDISELTLTDYDDDISDNWTPAKFKAEMERIWKSLEPYYKKLHAYVGLQLKKYPSFKTKLEEDNFGEFLPAHIFGNMWAQQWTGIGSITKPYPNATELDVTSAMVKKGYTPKKIFEVADEFFGGMGLQRMTPTFWEKSMLTKPKDREVVCHASAEDTCKGRGNTDFRIKMCTKVTLDDLVTAHHEMGHIEYFMQYTNERMTFRDGANPGFHEALGDTLALAVTTPKHLQCVLELDLGLDLNCGDQKNDPQTPPPPPSPTDINFLYSMALEKIVFLPFALSVDKWRWEVSEGKVSPANYSTRWWEIRKENQRLVPPGERNPMTFDPAAKYHIVANVEYIRYFISHILQFQFYEAMCITAKEFTPGSPTSKPLYQCDFAGNKEAGKKLADMMSMGFREPWPKALKVLTGQGELSTSSLITYFTPLFDELDKRLKEAGISV